MAHPLTEQQIIQLLTRRLRPPPHGALPIGDDVATLRTTDATLVAKADMLVAHTDMPPRMTWRQAARKAVVMAVSDFAGKGVRPRAALVSLGLPRSIQRAQIEALAKGFADAEREFDLHILGGDTNEARELVIDCLLLGFATHVTRRRGAQPGNHVYVSGPFGYTAAGLQILLRNGRADPRFRGRALRRVLQPMPRLALGLQLAERRLATAALDSSDGLALSLHQLAAQSGVAIYITRHPTAPGVHTFAAANRVPWDDLVWFGGEEYELVFTASPGSASRLQQLAKELRTPIIQIGEVREGHGVRWRSKGRLRPLPRRGWMHFTRH